MDQHRSIPARTISPAWLFPRPHSGAAYSSHQLKEAPMPHTRLDAAATLPGEDFSRVALTPESVDLLRKLWEQHGPLMFHQSGGCCDGSSPMCYPAGEFITGDSDVLLGLFDISG